MVRGEGVNEGLQSHRGITKDNQPHRGGGGEGEGGLLKVGGCMNRGRESQ